jgi:glycerol-3-phosphate dehydrogenase (NAD(P)+)
MKVAVIGAGSWGTAIAQVLADAGHNVSIQAREPQVVEGINTHHKNPMYLSDYTLPAGVVAYESFADALPGVEACVFVTPSKYLRATAAAAAPYMPADCVLINASKGTEESTGNLASDILAEVFSAQNGEGTEAAATVFAVDSPATAPSPSANIQNRIAVLSGPTHAEEVIRRIPSGAVCASINADCATFTANLFATDYFRTYTSQDVTGVELCAAFKNVIAIAVGLAYGLGMGDDTAAMLITRGLAEMSRMVVACGGEALTCMGLAGAGDMVVTCMSRHSRNRRFGEDYLAKGRTLADFEADTHMVVEGAQAAHTLEVLEKRHGVELPLTSSMRQIIWEHADATEIAQTLKTRPLKPEIY